MATAEIITRLGYSDAFDFEDFRPMFEKLFNQAKARGDLDLPASENPGGDAVTCTQVGRVDAIWFDEERANSAAIFVGSDEDRHTIIAALRFWQEKGMCDPANRSNELHEIATNNGELISLCDLDVDTLVEQINV